MGIRKEEMKISVLSLAVQSALAVMFVMPMMASAEEDIAVIRRPTNFVEIGAENVGQKSAKFGEYNGLNKSGGELIGNFSVRGGDAYEGGNGTMRWGVTGKDLGTTSREFGATVGNQGQWNLGIGYDELRHNLSDTYQTPYQGSMGGNNFTLPATFGTVATGSALAGTRTLNPVTQLPALQTVDIGSTRKKTSFNAGFNFNPYWNVKLEYGHLDQSGAKLRSFGSDAHGGGTGENISILPDPTNYKTDTVNLSLNWVGDKGHATASYLGSSFRDGFDRVTWTTFGNAQVTDTMTTAPSNNFHQLNLMGGYALAAKTKLVGGFSYARNTQNDSFVTPDIMVTAMPVSSLNGVIKTTHADLKLMDHTVSNLALSAGIKYDKRDNQTASNIYNFNAIDGGNPANYPNTPLSNKKTQVELAGDYRLDKSQHILLAYNYEQVKRWCNNYAVNANYPAGTNCVVDTGSKDNKLGATYKLKANDDVNLSVGYSFSKRASDYDQNARAAMIGKNGNVIVAGATITGINAGDFVGFHPYFDASRKEQVLKAGVNWQANDKLTLGANGRYADDHYDSTYGVKNGSTWSLNLDAIYSYAENGSFSAYVTQQDRKRDMTNMALSPTAAAATVASNRAINVPLGATWNNSLKDTDTTLGLGFKQGGLMGGKLELVGDLTYSLAKTGYTTQLNWAGLTTLGVGCSDPILLTCGSTPDIKNATTQFKLTGTYQVDKSSKVAVGYLYRRLSSDDYYYNGLQYGFTPQGLMPTNQQSGSYNVNVVAVSYMYSFK